MNIEWESFIWGLILGIAGIILMLIWHSNEKETRAQFTKSNVQLISAGLMGIVSGLYFIFKAL
ncbi:hypothetical protein EFB08_03020 [Rufibacter latericius]|uniref:Uncharacterized protein n=1 Tax=Rufibacter latericius TaxID=2487040 RepID=A0A3M9N1B0_9BACT|nr:hypothetical protein EFB08_03020 [Rufibacter latericius]